MFEFLFQVKSNLGEVVHCATNALFSIQIDTASDYALLALSTQPRLNSAVQIRYSVCSSPKKRALSGLREENSS